MQVAQVPPAIVKIAQRVQSQEQGAVSYRYRRIFDVHAGPRHRHDDMTLAIVNDGATTVKVRVIQDLIGGKAADAQQIAQLEDAYEHPKPGDVFHRPFDPRYLNEYTYEQVNAQEYKFGSSIHDSSHGSGTFNLDDQDNVVKYQYSPYALPPYTHSGTISDVRAAVLPDFWWLTQDIEQYSGRYFIFGGGANVAITYDSFRRYPSVDAAVSALNTACGTGTLCNALPQGTGGSVKP
jgi:hypothetical protein